MHAAISTSANTPTRARAAIFGIFGVNGFLLAMWVVHIPTIGRRTDISNATLGSLLLVLAAGGLIGMQATGPIADRWGSNRSVIASGLLLATSVVGPAFATDVLGLAVALLAFGLCNGAVDVSMNSQAVDVERLYGRPIMSAFHALFSIGGVAGSLVGALTLSLGVDLRLSMGGAGLVGALVVLLCVTSVLPTQPRTRTTADTDHGRARAPLPRAPLSRVLALGALAFALFLCEGVANDWSALQVKEHLGIADGAAALAFGFFAAMMTVGRFLADRISAVVGPVAIVRFGALIASVGMIIVIGSQWFPLTLFGWALFGLGLSGGIPQIFSTAGNLGGAGAATNMSRVVGLGYLGLLAGPAVIGWTSHVLPLTTTMAIPLALTLMTVCVAPVVRPRADASSQARQ